MIRRLFTYILFASASLLTLQAQSASSATTDTINNGVTADIDTEVSSDSVDTDDELYIFADMFDDSIPDTPVRPSMLYLPLIFQQPICIDAYDTIPVEPYNPLKPAEMKLRPSDQWLRQLERNNRFDMYQSYRTIVYHPDLVHYNIWDMPEPPKQYVITMAPDKLSMSIEEFIIKDAPSEKPQREDVKIKKWIRSFNASVQFSQAYLSDNWYQGGTSNLNLLGNFIFHAKLNPNVYTKLLFENTIQYKIGLNSAPQDSLRSYAINEDMFQINSMLGIKAIQKWYYTLSLQFKTQIFNNYTANTNNMKASFLSPGELNLGLGMTYSTANKKGTFNLNASMAPVSYNMKICREIEKIKPEWFGIEPGRHFAHQVGSKMEMTMNWKISLNVSMSTRFFVFTDYDYIQGDLENTLNFSINKYLSTQLYMHLRYDSSRDSDPTWKEWRFKEILSLGFSYKI